MTIQSWFRTLSVIVTSAVLLCSRHANAQGTIMKINFGVNEAMNGYAAAVEANYHGNVNKYHGGSGVIGSTDADSAFRSHIWSGSSGGYNITGLTPDGYYDVTLGFAESYTPNCKIGKRVFSATVGIETRDFIDVYQEAGCQNAYNLPFVGVKADSSGSIDVVITKGTSDNPFLSVLEVSEGSPPAPTPPPSTAPPTTTMAPTAFFSDWQLVNTGGTKPKARVEACFVMVGTLAYLIGGRGINPVDVYNPYTQTWTARTGPGLELHHMQCVPVGEKIWIVSSWTGSYPYEVNVPDIYIYDTVDNSWSTKPGLPENRRRGGAAAVLFNDEIYVSHGNRGGHGSHAESLAWLDKYNIATDSWTNMTDAPNPRDHTGGAIVNGMLCVAGGRDGGADDNNFFDAVVVETDCYNFATGQWEVKASLPQGRAASGYGTTCDGKMMLAGGEGFDRAWPNVDIFDGSTWTSAPDMVESRHGTGIAISCECNQVHIASGSITQAETLTASTETLFPLGIDEVCSTRQPTLSPTQPPTPSPTEDTDDAWGDDGWGSGGFVIPPTAQPTEAPSISPTMMPSIVPTKNPTTEPTPTPTPDPTPSPTITPTEVPTPDPTPAPTAAPTPDPTSKPTSEPTPLPMTPAPSKEPTPLPTTQAPSKEPPVPPTPLPTEYTPPTWSGGFVIPPTASPSASPSLVPTAVPTKVPSSSPSTTFSSSPSSGPSSSPSISTGVTVVKKYNFGGPAPDGFEEPVSADLVGNYNDYDGAGVTIEGPEENSAYASHLWIDGEGLEYTLRLASNEIYDVYLGFAESYEPNCQPGARVFSASVGSQTKPAIDVFSSSGCYIPYNLPFYNVQADENGDLPITLSRGAAENPFLALLEVTTPSGGPPLPSQNVAESKINFGRYSTTGNYEAPNLSQFVGAYNFYAGDGQEIADTDEDLAYESHVWVPGTNLTYTLELEANEEYDIKLGWAESYSPNCFVASRIFSVEVNNEREDNIDVYSRSGDCFKPYTLTFRNVLADASGHINVTLIKGPAENAFLSLIDATKSVDVAQDTNSGGFVLPTQEPTQDPYAPVLQIQFGRPNSIVYEYQPAVASNFVGGDHVTFQGSSSDIGNTADSLVYAGHVWTPEPYLTYRLDLDEKEEYDLILGFSETYGPNCVEGARVFSVAVGGLLVSNIDVYKEAGCQQAYDIVFEYVPGGLADITLIRGPIENPFLSVVRVYQAGVAKSLGARDNKTREDDRTPRDPDGRPGDQGDRIPRDPAGRPGNQSGGGDRGSTGILGTLLGQLPNGRMNNQDTNKRSGAGSHPSRRAPTISSSSSSAPAGRSSRTITSSPVGASTRETKEARSQNSQSH
jgi:hypothetical protein